MGRERERDVQQSTRMKQRLGNRERARTQEASFLPAFLPAAKTWFYGRGSGGWGGLRNTC